MSQKIYSENWKDYELIDAGGNKKLERWGKIITIRPERQAYFKSEIPFKEWEKLAHLEFEEKGKLSGKWKYMKNLPEKEWKINFHELTFLLQPTQFKHLGLFPEQEVNWRFIEKHLLPDTKMLNLFAYTGAASIVGRKVGARVTHVDSVKQLISWAKTNMENSNLQDIRWIHDDALKFVQKEIKRENSYDLIVMDPPAWGIGANNEKWKLEHKIDELIDLTSQLLTPQGHLIVNTYSPKVTLEILKETTARYFQEFSVSELWKKTTTQKELFYGHLVRAKNTNKTPFQSKKYSF